MFLSAPKHCLLLLLLKVPKEIGQRSKTGYMLDEFDSTGSERFSLCNMPTQVALSAEKRVKKKREAAQ